MLESELLIDTHCHFDFQAFDNDRNALWQRCQQLSIQQLIIPGVNPNDLGKARHLSQTLSGIFFAAGLHPWWILGNGSKPEEVSAGIGRALAENKCVAVGECGLDKLINVPMARQIDCLAQHLLLAQQFDMPVILHNRKANNELLQVLNKYPLNRGGVVHGFSGSYEFGQQLLQRGLLLGVGGTISYPRAKKTRAALAALPLECLVLETDAPDMPLNGRQGQRNTPETLLDIASCLAQIKQLPLERVIRQTTMNAQKLFRI